ncbi:MAG: hypothetical protein Q6373_000295 [Candidatus Sigynarchaeota archaeon]
MKAIAGTIVSIGAAVLYSILCMMFALVDPLIFLEAAGTLVEGLVMFLLTIAFLPILIFLKVLAIVVFGLVITGAILTAVGKTKPGGIIMIVGSAVGCFFALFWYFIPLAVGITGGILTLVNK